MYKNVLQSSSHEIHTYLNGILGYISLLEFTSLDEKQTKQVKKIQQSGENLLALIDDTILYNSYCNHPIEVVKKACTLETMLAEVKESMGAFAQSKGKELVWEQQIAKGKMIETDEERIKILLNKVLKFFLLMTEDKEVRLKIVSDDTTPLLFNLHASEVIVPKEKSHLVFDKISPTDIPEVRKKDCSGFELAIAKKILESLNGKINLINSEQGTALECRLN